MYINTTKFFFVNSDCVILGYDITRKESFNNIDCDWYPLAKKISGANLYYLIGNKIDLINDEKVSEQEARDYAKKITWDFF